MHSPFMLHIRHVKLCYMWHINSLYAYSQLRYYKLDGRLFDSREGGCYQRVHIIFQIHPDKLKYIMGKTEIFIFLKPR